MKNEAMMRADDKKYEIENDLRSLMSAMEIRKDKPRYAAAMKLAKDKAAELTKIADKK